MAEKDLKETNKEVAAAYAKSKGRSSIGEITREANAMMASENPAERAIGKAIAQQTVQDLLLLCLRQEIMDNPLPDYMNLTERVFDGWMTEGNQKEYVADIDTGVSSYSNTPFVPSAQTIQKLEQWTLQIYTKNGSSQPTLSPQAYQFKKEQTLPVNEWLPYFKKNALNEYITKKQQSLNRAYKIFIYNKLCELIVAENGKVITGQANNLYDALLELAPEIDGMLMYNHEYNKEQQSKLAYTSKAEDILIFTSKKVRSAIMNGVKAQVFNANFIGTSERTYTYDNVKCLGNRVTQGDQSAINTVGNEWINDNTIIVVDISRIKHIIQIDENATQGFAANLTEYLAKHVWGVIDIMPWCKKIVYKNSNLRMIPTQVVSE